MEGDTIPSPYAGMIREGEIDKIEAVIIKQN